DVDLDALMAAPLLQANRIDHRERQCRAPRLSDDPAEPAVQPGRARYEHVDDPVRRQGPVGNVIEQLDIDDPTLDPLDHRHVGALVGHFYADADALFQLDRRVV